MAIADQVRADFVGARNVASAIEMRGVSKRFGSISVVEDVTLTVPSGTILGLIGPSGCGKTTIVRLMTGIIVPSAGTVRTLGIDPGKARSRDKVRVGYMPQGFVLYPGLSAIQNIRFVAGLYGVSWFQRGARIRELLDRFDLYDARDRKARLLSGGMQRRLQLACALVHRPDMLFVDEPTTGLDPLLRISILNYLKQLREEGMTIVMTTQLVDEAEFCDKLGLIVEGRLTHLGTLAELRQQAFQRERIELQSSAFPQGVEHMLESMVPGAWAHRVSETVMEVDVEDAPAAIPVIVRGLEGKGTKLKAVNIRPATFDEAFARLVSSDA